MSRGRKACRHCGRDLFQNHKCPGSIEQRRKVEERALAGFGRRALTLPHLRMNRDRDDPSGLWNPPK